MQLLSTRDTQSRVSLSQGIRAGLAPDGGLYVPCSLPQFEPQDFAGAADLASLGERLLQPFFQGEMLADQLPEICREAFSFAIPWRASTAPDLSILELFHGPTAAFKDVGARFLAACLSRLVDQATVLVATSGDTGGAVAAACAGVPGLRVVVLYPRGMVSPRQEHQLCCWPDNVLSLRVDGSFDDCQRLVKQAFVDAELNRRLALTSANSISIGRLLPQMVYYAHASLAQWRRQATAARFIVPTGNLGNALAGVWARHIGLPIASITLATNANRSIAEYLDSGHWQPRATVATLASAMDVGNPSNMERLRHLLPSAAVISAEVNAMTVDDEQIKETIRWADQTLGLAVCPHTATALQAYRWCRDGRSDWTVLATAHAAKFDQVVEPILQREIPMPAALSALLERPQRQVDMAADLESMRRLLYDWAA